MRSNLGCAVELPADETHIAFYAEDQARYVVTCAADAAASLIAKAKDANVQIDQLGQVGGDAFALIGHGQIAVESLKTAHESWFPTFMAGEM